MASSVLGQKSGESGAHRLQPVLRRLASHGAAAPELVRCVEALARRIDVVSANTTIQTESETVSRPRYVLSGWLCRQRHLTDGRRQIFGIILPGDGIGVCLDEVNPLAATTTVALTRCELVDASELLLPGGLERCSGLREAITAAGREDERRLLDQVVRLGRMAAIERVAHFLLELHDRLAVVGLAEKNRFPMPLTQEMLGDTLGISVVHVNRTLQDLRREGLIYIGQGEARLLNRPVLEEMADYVPRVPVAMAGGA